jgi:hypothetical protein
MGGRRLKVVAVDRVGSLDVIYRDFAQAFNKGPTSAHQENGITRTGKVKRWAAKSGPEWQILHIGEVLSGVLQGSVLWHLLFVIFNNEKRVLSGVCQGSVLGSLSFVIFFNNVDEMAILD